MGTLGPTKRINWKFETQSVPKICCFYIHYTTMIYWDCSQDFCVGTGGGGQCHKHFQAVTWSLRHDMEGKSTSNWHDKEEAEENCQRDPPPCWPLAIEAAFDNDIFPLIVLTFLLLLSVFSITPVSWPIVRSIYKQFLQNKLSQRILLHWELLYQEIFVLGVQDWMHKLKQPWDRYCQFFLWFLW